MSVEELQKRIEELEKENKQLKELVIEAKDILGMSGDAVCCGEKCLATRSSYDTDDFTELEEDEYYCEDCVPKDIVYQVRRYIEMNFWEDDDEEESELVEKRDFKTKKEAADYYYSIEKYGKNLSYYKKSEGDDDYCVIEEDFQKVVLQFNKIPVKDLKCLCKLHKIKGYSKMKKQQLLDILREHKYFNCRFDEERIEPKEEEEKKENYEEIYNKLQDKWINVWKEDNAYLVEETDNGTFSQLIPQSPFEEYCGSVPSYVYEGDGYWAPTLQEFIDYMDEEDWECSECNEEYDNNMRKCRVNGKIVCEDCE